MLKDAVTINEALDLVSAVMCGAYTLLRLTDSGSPGVPSTSHLSPTRYVRCVAPLAFGS